MQLLIFWRYVLYLKTAEQDWPSINATENNADLAAIGKETKTTKVVSVIKVKTSPVLGEQFALKESASLEGARDPLLC